MKIRKSLLQVLILENNEKIFLRTIDTQSCLNKGIDAMIDMAAKCKKRKTSASTTTSGQLLMELNVGSSSGCSLSNFILDHTPTKSLKNSTPSQGFWMFITSIPKSL